MDKAGKKLTTTQSSASFFTLDVWSSGWQHMVRIPKGFIAKISMSVSHVYSNSLFRSCANRSFLTISSGVYCQNQGGETSFQGALGICFAADKISSILMECFVFCADQVGPLDLTFGRTYSAFSVWRTEKSVF